MIKMFMKKFALSKQGSKDFIQAVVACAISDVALMAPVGLMYFLIRDLLKGKINTNTIIFYVIGILITLLIILATQWWRYNATFFSTYKESKTRRITLAETLRKLPLSFFGEKDIGDLTNTILNDCTVIEHAFSHEIPQFYGSIIATIMVAISLLFFDFRMAIAAIWVLPVSLISVLVSKKVQMRLQAKKTHTKIELENDTQEYIECSRDLKSYNAEGKFIDTIFKKIDKYEKQSIFAELGGAAFIVPAQMFTRIGIATTALLGVNLLVGRELNLITFIMFMVAVSRIYEPMSAALVYLGAINVTQVNIDRTREMNEIKQQKGMYKLNAQGCDIEFNNIAFAYDKSEQVLKNVDFVAKQGEVTALVGPSGGGKTTVSRLAARFWDVEKGNIKLGGVDISTVNPEVLLKKYSIVFQDVTLFDNSILENIRIGKENATDKEVMEAARLANVDEFALKLPDKYDTKIGENGTLLSGGERQRISIARAFLKDAPIILLDEATASLDAENETLIQNALSKLIKNKTVLIIAHRMRTVLGADKIVVIKDGESKEQGSPDELYKSNGMFTRMVDLQYGKGYKEFK